MGYTSLIDHNELLHAFLTSQSALVSAAPGGIYGPPGLPIGWQPSDGKTIVFVESTGSPQVEVPVVRPIYQFRCYALEPPDSRALAIVLVNALHRRNKARIAITGGHGLVVFGRANGLPINMSEPQTEWNFDMVMIELHFAENLVS